MQKRIDIRVDNEVEKIIETNIRSNETPLQCYKRLAKAGAENQKILETMREEYQRTLYQIFEAFQTNLAEQKASNERLIGAIESSSGQQNLRNLPSTIEKQVQDFTESVKKPFDDISSSLNAIEDHISRH